MAVILRLNRRDGVVAAKGPVDEEDLSAGPFDVGTGSG